MFFMNIIFPLKLIALKRPIVSATGNVWMELKFTMNSLKFTMRI